MDKKTVICTDIYDKDGNLTKIEVSESSGEHVFDSLWDPNEDQTSENRIAFRQWTYQMVKRKGYDVAQ